MYVDFSIYKADLIATASKDADIEGNKSKNLDKKYKFKRVSLNLSSRCFVCLGKATSQNLNDKKSF